MSSDFESDNVADSKNSDRDSPLLPPAVRSISTSSPESTPSSPLTTTPSPQAKFASAADSLRADQDKYLHPISLIFSMIKLIRSNVVPAIFGLLGAANGEVFYIVLSAVFLVPAIVLSIVRYFTLRYRISDGELVVNEGLLFRRTRTVPIERIQNIDLVQGVLHRLFKVAEVRVETASGTKPEAVLSVLSLTQVELLRRSVFELKSARSATAPNNHADFMMPGSTDGHPTGGDSDQREASQSASATDKELLTIPIQWLARAGFASNRGFIMVGVLLGLYFQYDSRTGEDYDFTFLQQWLPASENVYLGYALVAGAMLLALVLLRVLGVGWYILRFFGYRLSLAGDDFKISCGLLTKVSATVPRNRIQFISVHSGLIARWMGLASIRIETAGGSSSQNEDATTTVSRRWFIPVIASNQVDSMIAQLRPDIRWQPDDFDWRPLSGKALKRFIRIAIFIAVVLGPIGYLYIGWWGLLATPIALPALAWMAVKKSQAVRYARTPFGVVYRSGIMTRKLSLTFFEKIQAAAIGQTPFDRRWEMATLTVDTAAAGPADHKIEIKFLDASFAAQEYTKILQFASQEKQDGPQKTTAT